MRTSPAALAAVLACACMLTSQAGCTHNARGSAGDMGEQPVEWVREAAPPNSFGLMLTKVSFADADHGWACGSPDYDAIDKGARWLILRYDHGSWREFRAPDGILCEDIDATGPDEAWIVSHYQIAHWQNGSWDISDLSNLEGIAPLSSISMTADGEGWAVGSYLVVGDVILHRHAGQWQREAAPSLDGVKAVHAVSANEAWSVGPSSYAHFSGGVWERFSDPFPVPDSEGFNDLAIGGDGQGWGFGRPQVQIARYDQGRWTLVQRDGTYQLATGVRIDNEAWAVGRTSTSDVTSPYTGRIEHWDGSAWHTSRTPTELDAMPHWSLSSVAFPTSTAGWAVGYDDAAGQPIILRYVGGGR